MLQGRIEQARCIRRLANERTAIASLFQMVGKLQCSCQYVYTFHRVLHFIAIHIGGRRCVGSHRRKARLRRSENGFGKGDCLQDGICSVNQS